MDATDEKKSDRFPGWLIPWSIQNREKVLTFLICLLVATVLWFISALSKEYNTTLTYPVEYVDIPGNKFITNNPPDQFNLKISTQGFTIVKYKLIMSFNPLLIPVSEIVSGVVPSSSGFYVVTTWNISEILSHQLSTDVELLEITPQVLTLAFDSLDVRHVPVASRVEIGLKPRYGLSGPVTFEPSHITVTGPHEIVQTLDSVYTVPDKIENVDAPIRQRMALVLPRQLYLEPDRVILHAEVDEFTERSITIPVWISDQPDSSRVRLFPREVEVIFRIGLSNYTKIKPDDFSLYVSWDDIKNNAAQLKVQVKKSPSVINNLKIVPDYVEYLIEKN